MIRDKLLSLKVTSLKSGEGHVPVSFLPDVCPICRHGISPRYVCGVLDGERDNRGMSVGGRVQAVFQCPLRACRHLFIGSYEWAPTRGVDQNPARYVLRRLAPVTPRTEGFPQEIVALSPAFGHIYNQALAAEDLGLTDIAGMGYRKALEFLIKDFAIKQHPDKAGEIRRAQLSHCIRDFVQDPNVRLCSERAAWLGNDESHYERRWKDKDVGDLKVLIGLTCNWVQNVMVTERYSVGMQKTKV
jgi:hypothetical protein